MKTNTIQYKNLFPNKFFYHHERMGIYYRGAYAGCMWKVTFNHKTGAFLGLSDDTYAPSPFDMVTPYANEYQASVAFMDSYKEKV